MIGIEDIFDGLKTEDGKKNFLEKVIFDTDLPIPEKMMPMAKLMLEKEVSNTQQIISSFKECTGCFSFGWFSRSFKRDVIIAKRLGLKDEAKKIEDLMSKTGKEEINFLLENNKWLDAVWVAEGIGALAEALDICEKNGEFEEAAKFAERLGDGKRAKELLAKAFDIEMGKNNVTRAFDIAVKLKWKDKINELAEKTVDIREKLGEFDVIAKIYEKMGGKEEAEFYGEVVKFLDMHEKKNVCSCCI